MSDLTEQEEAAVAQEIFGKRPEARGRFYMHAVKNEDESQRLGFPVYQDRVYVEIRVPDEKDFVSRPAGPEEFARFAQSYARFKEFQNWNQHSLELLTKSPAQVAVLRDLKIYTIEQLAKHESSLPDSVAELQVRAKQFVRFWAGEKPRLRLVDGQLEVA